LKPKNVPSPRASGRALEPVAADIPHVTEMLAQKVATLSRALDQQAEAAIAVRTEMTLLECRLLAFVETYGPVTAGGLAARMFIDGGQMSRLISKLSNRGYLIRTRGADDQRTAYLTLSPDGRAAYSRMQRSVWNWHKKLAAQMHSVDIDNLNATLDNLIYFLSRTR